MHSAAGALTLADAIYPRVGIWQRDLVRDAVLVVSFTLLTALCAQIAVRLPFTPVPITGQTFAVLLTGGALGAWRGSTSMLLYALLGAIGLPVFAPDLNMTETGQVVHLVLPWKGSAALPWEISSGGYIIGFIFAAWLVGYLAERGWDRKVRVLLALLLGNITLYLPGLLWLAYLMSSGWVHPVAQQPLAELVPGNGAWDKALVAGLYPFVVGDLAKLYVASLALPGAWAWLTRGQR